MGRVDQSLFNMKNWIFTLFLSFHFLTLLFSQNVPAYVPTNGLVGWWPFSGNAIDSSGNGNHGTVNGATLTTDRFGNAGKAYSFDGVNDFILLANSGLINFSGGLTFSAWVKANDIRHASIVDKETNCNSYGYRISTRDNGDFWAEHSCYGIAQPGAYGVIANTNYTTSNWYFIVGTLDLQYGNRIYINGTQVDQGAVTQLINNTKNIEFGRSTLIQGEYFFGKIDDIGIWNRALTCQEIQALYSGQAVYQQPTVAAIQGPATVVAGNNINLTNATAGGVWSSSNTNIATVNNSGVVTAIAPGTDTIRYSVSDACGTYSVFQVITVSSACLPNYVPTNGLVGYWPFCGNANDESGNGNHGTVNGGVSLTQDRFGNNNTSYAFDGNVNTKIQVPLLNQLSGTRTYSFWFKIPVNFINPYLHFITCNNSGNDYK